MAISFKPLPYGLRDVKITPYSDAAATTLGTAVDLPNARTFSFTASEEFTDLRGDDVVVTTHGQGETIDWSLEAGGISLEAYKVLAGGTLTLTGTTPNQILTYKKTSSDTRPWFFVEGQAISDSGGDFHAIVEKCRATANLGGSLADTTYFLTACSGEGLPSTRTSHTGELYTFVQNETATSIA